MDSIDWDRLVNMYDADANGLLDPSELVCFVRDALSLVLGERIDYDLATDVTFSQIALRRECWSGRDVRVDAINSLALRQAAARGVFSELRLARARRQFLRRRSCEATARGRVRRDHGGRRRRIGGQQCPAGCLQRQAPESGVGYGTAPAAALLII